MQDILKQLEEEGFLEGLEAETIKLQDRAQPTMTIPDPVREQAPVLDRFHVTSGIEVQSMIAEGGMGSVFLGRQETIGRDVAVKAVRQERQSHHSAQALIKEARVTGRLEHPNIVPVHDLGIDAEGSPIFVMRKIDGVAWIDLLDHPERFPAFYEEMSELERHLEIFDQVCRAVHFAHDCGIWHRDIKPDNVMLGTHGEVYVVDWGLAATLPGAETFADLPATSEISRPSGTPAYMAPEMVDVDTEHMGPWTDVYLLGATLHTMLTGQARHKGKSVFAILVAAQRSEPIDYRGVLPEALGEICNRATRRDPAQRYPTVEHLRRAVAEFKRRRAAVVVLEQASEQLERLEHIAGNTERSEEEILEAYRLYSSSLFGFEAAAEIWPESQEAERGIQASHLAILDLEIAQGHVLKARALMGELSEPAPRQEAALEAKQRELGAERARVEALEKRTHDLDPRIDRRIRGRMFFGCVVMLLATNLTYVWLLRQGVLTRSPGLSIGLRALDTIIIQGFVSATMARARLNQSSRQFLQLVILTVWTGFVARALTLYMGLSLEASGSVESIVFTMGMAAVAITVDRRLHLIWPLMSCGIWVYLVAPEYALFTRILVNLLGLGFTAWLGLRGPAVSEAPETS